MKAFNLEEAKAGKAVCTKSGLPVRLLCFDRRNTQPILGLIDELDRELCHSWSLTGDFYTDDSPSVLDLKMV
jgi:hypothetical protein